MTDDEECIHGLWPASTCTICNGRDRRERTESAERPRVFAAKYAGHCNACNLPIHVGQSIAWTPELPPVHEGCTP